MKTSRTQGYLPIVTFQYKEGYSPQVMPWQENDFRGVAEAGAAIVSGSQSHVPMEMEFYKGSFIHYGLGNLFFGNRGTSRPVPGCLCSRLNAMNSSTGTSFMTAATSAPSY